MKTIIKPILILFIWISKKFFGADLIFYDKNRKNSFMTVAKDGKKLESIYLEEFDEYEIYETIKSRLYCGRYSRKDMGNMIAMYIVLGKVL